MIASHRLYLIACADAGLGIGKEARIPWKLKGDMGFFRTQTTTTRDPAKQHMVIMGRTTYESIPPAHRPLPGRVNVVLTRNTSIAFPDVLVAHSLDAAFAYAGAQVEDIYIIGGEAVYIDALAHPKVDGVYLTLLDRSFACDRFFPMIPDHWKSTVLHTEEEDGVAVHYHLYTNPHAHGASI